MSSSIRSDRRPGRNAGLTLIETVTAFALAATGILGTLHLHSRVMDSIQAMREDTLVHQALVNELETLKSLAMLEPGEGLAFRSIPALDSLHLAQPRVDLLPAEGPGLVEARVSIVWIGEHGRRIERSITTRIAAREAPAGE